MELQHKHVGEFWRRLIGWTCLGIGLLGMLLPIIPGIPFLIVGLVSLSTEHRWVRAVLIWAKRKLGKFWPRTFNMPRAPRKRSRILRRQDKASS
ncbi:MAG TPA: PGPGW domain-containing protein [Terracidiphilus sp.]|nr:PGPGW domain-containing protein [Terracidiphilus sp.]